jgi:competence protein ComEC
VQAQLPEPRAYWLAVPCVLVALLAMQPSRLSLQLTRRFAAGVCCFACGFAWAAWFAAERLSDALPAQWEGADIQLVGVIAAMPQPYERSLRFEFDVERVLTPYAEIPAHIALSWWGSPARDGKPATLPELHAGERWQLTVRLRRPHGALNPHGFDYEAWLLERNIRATGYIRPGGNRRVSVSVLRPQC